jgi:2-oxoglutarate ferredoxin oxidoreductase subunit beta
MLPHRFCPGCGHIQISRIVEKELIERDAILVGSVGCSVALPNLFEVIDTVSAAHGRALSVATAVKMAVPDKKVLVYAGDGDCCTIGAGELLHTILRNPKIVCVLIDNSNFAMTGHQMSALTPLAIKTKTTVMGRNESTNGIPLNVKLLTKQNSKVHYYLTHSVGKDGIELFKIQLKEALDYNGFSIIHVISPCPTFWGNVKKSYSYALEQYNLVIEDNKNKCGDECICKHMDSSSHTHYKDEV